MAGKRKPKVAKPKHDDLAKPSKWRLQHGTFSEPIRAADPETGLADHVAQFEQVAGPMQRGPVRSDAATHRGPRRHLEQQLARDARAEHPQVTAHGGQGTVVAREHDFVVASGVIGTLNVVDVPSFARELTVLALRLDGKVSGLGVDNDPARGGELAKAQFAKGVDVVFAAAGGSAGGSSGLRRLNTAQSDVITAAEFQWRQIAIHVVSSGRELRINNGPERIANLAKAGEDYVAFIGSDFVKEGLMAAEVLTKAVNGEAKASRQKNERRGFIMGLMG